MEFYDEDGRKIAEVGQFVAKRIRAADALDVRGDTPASPAEKPAPTAASAGGSPPVSVVLRELVGARLGVSVDAVDVGAGYYELGLGSADLLSLVGELGERLSVELSPTVMFEHRTIAELAAWLEPQLPAGAVVAAPVVPVPAEPSAPATPPVSVVLR
ncbi:acyl carrier protein, partial [Streptomyces sp. NRRL WC-3549]|uniref:acyl carrier protein n=1 Tax=Streptomyces sp. NRRL WC-3549 TaxID=1463925 RepID=UPI001F40A7E0